MDYCGNCLGLGAANKRTGLFNHLVSSCGDIRSWGSRKRHGFAAFFEFPWELRINDLSVLSEKDINLINSVSWIFQKQIKGVLASNTRIYQKGHIGIGLRCKKNIFLKKVL